MVILVCFVKLCYKKELIIRSKIHFRVSQTSKKIQRKKTKFSEYPVHAKRWMELSEIFKSPRDMSLG